MLSYEELAVKASQLDEKINESLVKKESLKTQELVSNSKASYQRSAYLKKLHEKLNLVIMSRNKAHEANKRLLSDFDRIQKHLALMDSKTEILMSKVDNQKTFLDTHYPNWREKANMFVSPSYISQENMFNMLDTLRCRLKESENVSFQNFPPSSKLNLDGHQSLASMLVNEKNGESSISRHNSKLIKDVSTENVVKSDDKKRTNSNRSIKIMSQKEPHITSNVHVEKTDTLTNITESVELPSNLRTDLTVGTATEEALSPRQSLDFSAENTTEDTSVVDPLQNAQKFSYKLPDTRYDDEELDTDFSEGNIENMLSPAKKPATSPVHSPKEQPRRSSKENIIDSPGGSVDTVIKSPPGYQKNKAAVKLSTPISKVSSSLLLNGLFALYYWAICTKRGGVFAISWSQ